MSGEGPDKVYVGSIPEFWFKYIESAVPVVFNAKKGRGLVEIDRIESKAYLITQFSFSHIITLTARQSHWQKNLNISLVEIDLTCNVEIIDEDMYNSWQTQKANK